MKKSYTFIEYNRKSCIKNNLLSLIIFVAMMVFSFLLFILLSNFYPYKQPGNGMSDLALIVMFLFLSIILMIITAIVTPFFLKVYQRFIDNLKSLITLWICIILNSISLYNLFQSYKFPVIYLLISTLGSLTSLTFKYRKGQTPIH